jgi:integrase
MAVRKLDQGKYLVRVTDHTGRDVRRVVAGKSLADELHNTLIGDRIRRRHGLVVEQTRMLLADHYEDWLHRFQHGAAGSRKPKERTLEDIVTVRPRLSSLDNLYLDEISREKLERLAASIVAEGYPTAARKTLSLAKRLLRDAEEHDVAIDRRALNATIARPKPKELRALTWEQVMQVASWMPEHAHRAVPFLSLSGLRVSEFCALEDEDVGDHLIRVRESKTDSGVRTVHLSDEAWRLLCEQRLSRRFRAETERDRPPLGPAAVGGAMPPTGLAPGVTSAPRPISRFVSALSKTGPAEVGGKGGDGYEPRPAEARVGGASTITVLFPNEDGNPYNRRSFHKVLARAGEKAGIAGLHPHELRSTCMTLMAREGVSFPTCKAQMGWSDRTAAHMLSIYLKLQEGQVREEVKLLDRLVAQETREEVAEA